MKVFFQALIGDGFCQMIFQILSITFRTTKSSVLSVNLITTLCSPMAAGLNIKLYFSVFTETLQFSVFLHLFVSVQVFVSSHIAFSSYTASSLHTADSLHTAGSLHTGMETFLIISFCTGYLKSFRHFYRYPPR